jgi:hypothetical protein
MISTAPRQVAVGVGAVEQPSAALAGVGQLAAEADGWQWGSPTVHPFPPDALVHRVDRREGVALVAVAGSEPLVSMKTTTGT